MSNSGSSIKLGIRAGGAGWQGGDDEFWGLDDLRVTITTDGVGVPAPAPWSLLLGTAALAAGLKRRRR